MKFDVIGEKGKHVVVMLTSSFCTRTHDLLL